MLQTILEREFAKRRERNPRFSLRAYAEYLGLPPGRLSEFLSGKRRIPEKQAKKIRERLGIKAELGESAFKEIEAAEFEVVAANIHFAILSLMDTEDFHPDADWIARRLDSSKIETRAALRRLETAGLLKRDGKRWRKAQPSVRTKSDVPSAAIRRAHVEKLEHALRSLQEVPVEQRDITSVTVAMHPERMPELKQLIREFRRRFERLAESVPSAEVYNLNIQFVPVSKITAASKEKQ